MTKEELQKRIEKKESEIEKIQKRIDKWSKGLRPADIAICEPFGNCIYGTAPRGMTWNGYHGTEEYQKAAAAYREYVKVHDNDIPRAEDWNKGPNIGEVQSAYRDLGEARHTLDKYKEQLQNLDKFESEDKIEVIWNFLRHWREESYKYYINQAKQLTELRASYEKDFEDYKKSEDYQKDLDRYLSRGYQKWNAEYTIEKYYKKDYFEDIDGFTFEITDRRGNVDTDKLNKTLDKDVKRKYEKLVQDVTEKAGEILDASNLKVNARGEISGTIKGSKNIVNLWLTFVPGYIQRPHYRGYCHIAK